MISRLLLVGIVGVLGLSLPDGAEWGTGLTWARTATSAGAGRREAVVAIEPIAVDKDPINRIAEELKRRIEGLDLTSAPIVTIPTRPRHEFAPVPSGDSIELKLVAEFCRIAEESEARATDAPRSIPQPVATEANEAVDRLFAENQVWVDPITVAKVSSGPAAPEKGPSFDLIAAVETVTDLADSLNRAAETVTDLADSLNRAAEEIAMTSIEAADPSIDCPCFEPIAVADDESSPAVELDRASEGRSVEPEADPGIGDAVRLTRNAALAWMNVLTKTIPTESASR
jgi:hypothetical protein